jgi:hypothetical protein
MVADLITDTSVSIMTSGWDITQANEALKKHPIHAALSHPMEVSTRCDQSSTCVGHAGECRPLNCLGVTRREQMSRTTIPVLEPWSNEELFSGVL